MQKTILAVVAALALAPVTASAAAERFTIEAEPSHLVFSVPYVHGILGEAVGEFEDLAGEVVYDAADPSASSVVIRVATASVKTQFEARDIDLRSERFLDAAEYPEAVFHSRRIEPVGDGFLARGDLELRGHRRPVTIRFEVQRLATESGPRLWVNGSTHLVRTDYGIEGPGLAGDFVIGDTVGLRFNLMLEPAPN